jgi:hypothetical protein
MVYARDTEAGELTFGVSGFLLRDALVMFDHQTDSLWSQFIGEAIDGPSQGTTLQLLPSRITSWSDWRSEYPQGTAMDKAGMGRFPAQSFVFDTEAAEFVGEQTAEGISSHDLVLGVIAGSVHVAFLMKELAPQRVLNVEIGGVPVVATADDGLYTGAVYKRTLDGEVLTFGSAADGFMVDAQTGSQWDVRIGAAVSGSHAGSSLERLPARQSFWFAWKAYNPGTRLR